MTSSRGPLFGSILCVGTAAAARLGPTYRMVALDMDGTLLDLNYDNQIFAHRLPAAFAKHHELTLEAASQQLGDHMAKVSGTMDFYRLNYWRDLTGLDILALHEQAAKAIHLEVDVGKGATTNEHLHTRVAVHGGIRLRIARDELLALLSSPLALLLLLLLGGGALALQAASPGLPLRLARHAAAEAQARLPAYRDELYRLVAQGS